MTNTNLSTTTPSSTELTVVNLDTHRITRGQLAWSRIKATAAEQRELWRQVGEALLVGKEQNPSNQGFGKWCDEYGFGIEDGMSAQLRSDTLWLAYNWGAVMYFLKDSSYRHGNTALTDPKNIRQWYRDYIREGDLPESLQDLPIEAKPTVTLDQRSAEKLAKLINRSTSGDEGSETAKRHVESIAKRHGVSSEELKEVVANTAPNEFFQMSVRQLEYIQDLEETLMGNVRILVREGLTKEAISAVLIKMSNTVKGA